MYDTNYISAGAAIPNKILMHNQANAQQTETAAIPGNWQYKIQHYGNRKIQNTFICRTQPNKSGGWYCGAQDKTYVLSMCASMKSKYRRSKRKKIHSAPLSTTNDQRGNHQSTIRHQTSSTIRHQTSITNPDQDRN
jgi:hypothetical protein